MDKVQEIRKDPMEVLIEETHLFFLKKSHKIEQKDRDLFLNIDFFFG